MNKEDMDKFREGIPAWVDTGSSMYCLLENLKNADSYDDPFLDWVHERGFTEDELKKVIYQLDRERIIAIDPYRDFVEVEAYKPQTCKGIRRLQRLYRIEQEYGCLEYEKVKEDTQEKYLLVKEKDTGKEEEFFSTEALERHYGIGWEDRREHRKGNPSKYDNLEVTEKYKVVNKFIGNVTYFIRRPDGSKLYEGKKFDKLIRSRIFSEYFEKEQLWLKKR